MTRPLIEIMRDAWAGAIIQGRNPKHWLLNDAAKLRLLSEAKGWSTDLPAPKDDEFMPPIFGVAVHPAVKLWDEPDIARFELIVDEIEEGKELAPMISPPLLEMLPGTPTIDENYFGQLILEGRGADRTTPTQVEMIIDELRRRDVDEPGLSDAERERRSRAWNINPPCPTCGSFDHFEC